MSKFEPKGKRLRTRFSRIAPTLLAALEKRPAQVIPQLLPAEFKNPQGIRAGHGLLIGLLAVILSFGQPAQSAIPATPTGLNPGSSSSPGPTLASSTVTLNWSAPGGATSYGLGVRDIASGTLVVNTTVDSASYTASLAAGRQYRWNVNACNGAGCSSYASDLYFQTPTAVTIPATPTGLNPGSSSSPGPTLASSTVTLNWSAPGGATSYGLGVRDIASGTLVVNTTVDSASYTASLAAGRQYRWNVNACNSAGCSSYAADLFFQTSTAVTIPATPTGLNPGSSSSPGPTLASSTVTLNWSAPGATSYGLGVRDIASGTLVVNTTVDSASYSASLAAGRQYRWNVNACNGAGCSSYASDLYFQTPTAVTIPATPTGLNPGSSSSPGPTLASSTVTLNWSAPGGATSYGLGVRDIASGTLVVNTTVDSASYTASLAAGRQYRWNVNACNGAGCSSYASDLYFQTPTAVTIPATPTGLNPGSSSSPGPTLASSTVTLNWSAPGGATSYGLGVRDIASGTLVVNTTVDSASYTASLAAGRQYRWNVNACNSAGCSSYAADLFFQTSTAVTIPATPTGLNPGSSSSPGPTLASSTVTLNWSAPGATSYGLGVRDIASGTLVVNTTVDSASYTASLAAGRQYRWNVNACNSAGCSSYAADLFFQTSTAVTIPATPTGLNPGSSSSPGPTLASSTVTLNWSAPGATSYGLGVRDIASGTLVVNTTVDSASYSASLAAGRQYRWNVNACNSAGCSTSTSDLYFQTPTAVIAPTAQVATDTGFYYPVQPKYGYVAGYHMIGGLLPISTEYGGHFMSPSSQRIDPQTGNAGSYVLNYYHDGYDILADYGEAVYPITGGTVVQISQGPNSGWSSSGGCSPSPCTENLAIIIEHATVTGQAFRAIYGHIEAATLSPQVSIGTWVSPETLLGRVGTWSLGNHLHFGVNLTDVNLPLPYKGEDASTSVTEVIGWGRIGIDHWPQGGWPDREGWVDPVFFIETNSPNRSINAKDEIAKSDMKQYLVAHIESDLIPDDTSFSFYSQDAYFEYRYELFYNAQNQGFLIVHATNIVNPQVRLVNYTSIAEPMWHRWFQIIVYP